MEKIKDYHMRMFDPHSCSRSKRLNFIRVYRMVDNTENSVRKEKTSFKMQSMSHHHLESMTDSSIESVPLSFLVYRNLDKLSQ